MSVSRSVIATCSLCKQQYFEPEPKSHKKSRCGHCQLVRSWASDGSPKSEQECAEFRQRQIERNIALRPRVNDVLKDIDEA
jgi:hypothetical protein